MVMLIQGSYSAIQQVAYVKHVNDDLLVEQFLFCK